MIITNKKDLNILNQFEIEFGNDKIEIVNQIKYLDDKFGLNKNVDYVCRKLNFKTFFVSIHRLLPLPYDFNRTYTDIDCEILCTELKAPHLYI